LSSVADSPALETPPRIRVAPAGADSEMGEAAVELGRAYVVDLYDWQEDILICWLSRGPGGLWACPTCGLVVPRQNGKTKAVTVTYMFFVAAVLGMTVRYSAHRVDSTLEVFMILVDIFGNPKVPEEEWPYPELHRLVKSFSFKNGHEAIELKNGGSIRFAARSTGSGRGSTVDINIYDEAQFLSDDQISAALPNQSAAPSGNPQEVYIGTPPSEAGFTAEVFGRNRRNAIDGEPGYSWHEWSVDEIGDVADRRRWFETNPSLGRSLLLSSVERELVKLSRDKFAIERLCYWPQSVTPFAIDQAKWDAGATKERGDDTFDVAPLFPDDGAISKLAAGVKFDPDGASVRVSIAALCRGGRGREHVHVELVFDDETFGGLGWLVDWLVARKDRIASVAIDGRAGAQALHDELRRAGMPKKALRVMSATEVVAAATALVQLVNARRLTHYPDQTLDASAHGAVRRKIGADGYGFGGDSYAVESAADAAWAAMTTKRNPMQGEMVG